MNLGFKCKDCRREILEDDLKRFCPICGSKRLQDKSDELLNAIIEQLEHIAPNEDALRVANIMTYELGDFTKKMFYAKIHPERRDVCLIEAKIALSDLLTQAHLICKREGWSFRELEALGLERAFERIGGRI